MDSGSCFLSGEWMTGMGEQFRGTFDTVSRLEALNRREAQWGQGAKSLAGFRGDAPEQVWAAAQESRRKRSLRADREAVYD